MKVESILLLIAFSSYFIATIAYVISFVSRWDVIGKAGTVIILTGFICHTTAIGIRMAVAKRLVGYNFYEYMSIFAWGTILIYLIVERIKKVRAIGMFVIPVGFLLIGYASILPKDVQPLVPALRSFWLQIHIVTTMIAYSSFTLSFGTGILYLIKGKIPLAAGIPADALDGIMSKAVAFGFFFLTIGILTGAIWAQWIWNSAWSWDPKETSSLITWLIFAACLHTRFARGWRGKRAAVLSIIGFICVIFTYLGVDLIVPRAHAFLFKSRL